MSRNSIFLNFLLNIFTPIQKYIHYIMWEILTNNNKWYLDELRKKASSMKCLEQTLIIFLDFLFPLLTVLPMFVFYLQVLYIHSYLSTELYSYWLQETNDNWYYFQSSKMFYSHKYYNIHGSWTFFDYAANTNLKLLKLHVYLI